MSLVAIQLCLSETALADYIPRNFQMDHIPIPISRFQWSIRFQDNPQSYKILQKNRIIAFVSSQANIFAAPFEFSLWVRGVTKQYYWREFASPGRQPTNGS